jgi:hypothetical protein
MVDLDAVLLFFSVSLPEQLLMAAFAWLMLGEYQKVKLLKVLSVGVLGAVLFYIVRWLIPDLMYSVLPQFIIFTVLIFIAYKLNFVEAIIGSLITFVVFIVTQSTVLSTIFLITGLAKEDFNANPYLAIASAMVYFMVMFMMCYVFYKTNINIHCLKGRTKDKLYISRIRILVLQLSFGYLNLLIVYTLFFNNINVTGVTVNKLLIILCLVLNIVFTVIMVKSVFKMGDVVKKEEELKRKYDGREIIQNINYICSLIDSKEYKEVKKFLESMKNDVDDKIVSDKNSTNRTD